MNLIIAIAIFYYQKIIKYLRVNKNNVNKTR